MNYNRSHPMVNLTFILAAVFLFIASVLLALLLGARVYGNIEEAASTRYNERVCLSYLVTKIHAGDRGGDGIRVGEFGGVPALYIDEALTDGSYETVVYAYDGWIRELLREKGLVLPPGAGVPLLEVESLSFHFERANLLSIAYVGKDGGSRVAFAHLRSFGEDGL